VQDRRLGQAHDGLVHRCGERLGKLAMRLRNRADAEVHAGDLGQQVADLELGEVVVRTERADQRQRARPDLAGRNACRQCGAVLLATAHAAAGAQAVLTDEGPYRRHVEDLMAQRLVVGDNRCTALTGLGWRAVDDLIDFALVEQRAKASLVALLGAARPLAGAALGPIATAAWAV
jgi:hypothetical protein